MLSQDSFMSMNNNPEPQSATSTEFPQQNLPFIKSEDPQENSGKLYRSFLHLFSRLAPIPGSRESQVGHYH